MRHKFTESKNPHGSELAQRLNQIYLPSDHELMAARGAIITYIDSIANGNLQPTSDVLNTIIKAVVISLRWSPNHLPRATPQDKSGRSPSWPDRTPPPAAGQKPRGRTMLRLLRAIRRLTAAIAERNRRMSELDDTLTEIANNLASISTQLAKGFNEITTKLDELAATPGETVNPETLDALREQVAALAEQAQAIDDVVPDASPDDDAPEVNPL